MLICIVSTAVPYKYAACVLWVCCFGVLAADADIIVKPSLSDLVGSWRFSDYCMFGAIYGVGILWSFGISRPFPSVMQRLVVYHGISHLFFVLGLTAMATVPYRRLTGYWDNGLRWSKPEDKLKKFDATSHFEKATGWDRFRVKTE